MKASKDAPFEPSGLQKSSQSVPIKLQHLWSISGGKWIIDLTYKHGKIEYFLFLDCLNMSKQPLD